MESVPVQNQAAAQKLLQKLSQPNQDGQPRKSWKNRGKEKHEDPVVFTLEEYETRKFQGKAPIKDEVLDISRDENLAWQLQNQFNLEDSQVSMLLSSCMIVLLSCLSFIFFFLLPLRFSDVLYATCSATKGFS